MKTSLWRSGSAGHPTRKKGRIPVLGALLLLVGASGGVRVRAAVVDGALVERLSAEMRTGNPALLALEQRAAAADHQAGGVRNWADPRFQIGGEVTREGQAMSRSRGDLIYGLQQSLPVLGRERAARKVADAAAETAATRLEARFQELRRDLTEALLESAYVETVVGLDREDLAWLATLEAATTARVAARTARASGLVRIQNEVARRSADLTNDLAVLGIRGVTVNRLLGRPEDSGMEPLELPPVTRAVPPGPALMGLALQAEPRMQVIRRLRTEAERTVELTRRTRRPDVAIGVQGRQYSGDAGFREGMFTLSLNLPWLNRTAYRRDLQRDQARLQATDLDQADLELAVREEIHHLTTRIANAERDARLYQDDILPRLQLLAADTEAQWVSGQAGVDEVLSVRRDLLGARRMLARSIADEWVALGELLLCCGLEDLDTLQSVALSVATLPATVDPATP